MCCECSPGIALAVLYYRRAMVSSIHPTLQMPSVKLITHYALAYTCVKKRLPIKRASTAMSP